MEGNMLQNLIDIFAAPRAVFTRLLDKPSVLFPLALLLVAMASIQVGYIATSDHGFLIDQLVDQAIAANPTARESDVRAAYERLDPAVLMGIGAASVCVFLSVILLVNAVYLNFMGKFGHQGRSYRQWLSLLCWCAMPSLLVALAAWVAILGGNGQVSMGALLPLSLDSLLGLNTGKQLLMNLTLPQFWSMALTVLGYRCYTGASITRSAVITLAPFVLIYGLWAWFSFR
jgi:hypothetical protein